MGSRVADPRKEALYEYGMQVLNNKNNADEELKDRGKALMARYVDEVIRGQIELVQEYTEDAEDLVSESRSEDEEDSYEVDDSFVSDSDDDEMDSRLESSVHSEEKEKERELEKVFGSASDWEEKDGAPYSVSDLFNIADAVNLYANSLVSRGFW